jgi:D-alanyl-D-alanine carboxypeptidase (penicillin-binding protein 5/6)
MTSPAKHALLLDLSTGSVLFEKNATQRMHPSSMTKILTLYLLLETLAQNNIKLTDLIQVSTQASKQTGSRMFLKPQENVAVEDILKGISVLSGNDACFALAERLAGNEALFADMMNEKAKELGATDSHFVNASGLSHPNHWSTCWDLARIGQKTIENFPKEYAKYYAIPEFSFNGITQKNRNGLLKDRFADGLKTGKTDAGKCGIIASSIRHGRRLMLVLNGIETELIREEEARRLLNWGFQFFQPVVFFKKNQKVVDVPLWKGETLALIAPQTIGVSLPRRLLQQVKVTIKYPTPLMRPILKGQKVGILSITVPNQAPMEFPLIAAEEAPETGLFHFIWGKKAKK